MSASVLGSPMCCVRWPAWVTPRVTRTTADLGRSNEPAHRLPMAVSDHGDVGVVGNYSSCPRRPSVPQDVNKHKSVVGLVRPDLESGAVVEVVVARTPRSEAGHIAAAEPGGLASGT